MNKTIFITGASSGVGFEIAKLFLKQGHKVYALARNKKGLELLTKEAKDYRGIIIPINFDLEAFSKVELEKKVKKIDYIDILINNAGVIINKPFLQIQEKEMKTLTDINYFSVIKLIQVLHSKLKKAKEPHIVNIGSIGGITGSVKFPGLSIYSSSKGALSILSECLAQEFSEDNIKVNCLALGAVNTKMLKQAFPEYKAQITPQQMANYIVSFSLSGANIVNGHTQSLSISNP